ncbi:MAG: heme/copper-type cytochrome/quinol oxidase, subunit 3, partial [Aeromicrobium sp.]|nr:heme/copper-type cytochrome/quinol oxidase, subunit 3 [Aeromicrobium sp.]
MTVVHEPTPATRRLPGVEGVWVLICGDLAIFTLLFGSFMSARMGDPSAFEHGRHALSYTRGGINTLFLLTSSWCVVSALHAARESRRVPAGRWLVAGILCGVGFAVSKIIEYTVEVGAGHSVGTSD